MISWLRIDLAAPTALLRCNSQSLKRESADPNQRQPIVPPILIQCIVTAGYYYDNLNIIFDCNRQQSTMHHGVVKRSICLARLMMVLIKHVLLLNGLLALLSSG